MFIRASALVLAVAASVIAAPSATTNQCNTGSPSCCNTDELGLLSCTPITVIGTGSSADCTSDPVCCTQSTFQSVISWDCSPIDIDL